VNLDRGATVDGARSMSRHADRLAQMSAVAVGFSIPLTIALNNVFLGLALIGWVVGSTLEEKLRPLKHPAAIPALILFALLALGSLYAEVGIDASLLHLRKYIDLLLIPVFLSLFRVPGVRRKAILAFAASLAFVLFLSYMLKAGLLVGLPFIQGNPANPAVFKYHLTHNILMAFGVFLFGWLALDARARGMRLAWAVLAILALINVTLMVRGATGYMILAALVLLFATRRAHWLGPGIAALTVALLAGALLVGGNPFYQRVSRTVKELQAWRVDQPAQSSPALRLEFYRTTLSIIADEPLAGVGTGGFARAYAEKVKGTGKVATENPHNEFLLMWAQLGVAGLVALVWLFWRQWQLAARLPTRLERELAYGLILTMVIGSLLNSLLLDHTEGLFYAWLTGVLYGGLKTDGADRATSSETRAAPEAIVR